MVGAPSGPTGSPVWPPLHRDVPQQWRICTNAWSMSVLAVFTGAAEHLLGYWARTGVLGLTGQDLMACHEFTGSTAPTCLHTCRMFNDRSHSSLPASRSSPYADPLLLRGCQARLLQTDDGWCLPSRSDPIWTTSSPSTLNFPLSSLAASRLEINLAQCFLVIENVFFLRGAQNLGQHMPVQALPQMNSKISCKANNLEFCALIRAS